jgi:hypothetical protein
MKPVKHVGFKGAVASVKSKGGYSEESAEKIIGYAKAHASASAKKRNPALTKKGGRGR